MFKKSPKKRLYLPQVINRLEVTIPVPVHRQPLPKIRGIKKYFSYHDIAFIPRNSGTPQQKKGECNSA